MRYQYFVNFTSDKTDKSKIIYKSNDKDQAIATAKEKQAKFKAAKRFGMISVFEISYERGFPMQKVFEYLEV